MNTDEQSQADAGDIAVEIFTKPNLLSRAFIETPCESSWDKMTGNDSVRFCGQCKLNVYNVANLTDAEAEKVFARGREEGRVCARLFRRPDGTIMTDNCPRALRKIRDSSKWLKAKVVAGFALLLSVFTPAQADETKKNANSPGKLGEIYVPPKKVPVQSSTAEMAGGLAFMPPDTNAYKNEIANSLHKKWKEIGISAPYPQVQFKIGVDGKTSASKIMVSSGSKETDRKALTAISTASFTAPPLHTPLPFEVKVGGKTDCGETK